MSAVELMNTIWNENILVFASQTENIHVVVYYVDDSKIFAVVTCNGNSIHYDVTSETVYDVVDGKRKRVGVTYTLTQGEVSHTIGFNTVTKTAVLS